MTRTELRQIAEIERVEQALQKTRSKYLKRDYKKYLARLKRELPECRRREHGTS